MAKPGLNLDLPTADDLFSTQEERDDAKREKLLDIPIAQISDFPNHPFKVVANEEMLEMAESVRQNGILVPALVRPTSEGGYQMIAGHRRKMASELAQLTTIPCIVRNLTDDQAIIVMVDSNLQREKITPSEKAFAYKMKLEAIKRQGERTDLTSAPMEQKSLGVISRDIVAQESGESKSQIQRYIRLTELAPPILQMVDEGKVAFRPAVELSYLPKEEQQALFETMECEDATPSLAQAQKMRKFSAEGRLNEDVMLSIMSEEKPNQKEQVKIPREKLGKFFPAGTPAAKIEETIIKALELYRKRERDQER